MEASFEHIEGERYRLVGRIHHDNAVALRSLGEQLIRGNSDKLEVDLSALESSASVVLSLLLSWVRAARVHNKEIVYCNIPFRLFDMARVSGLDKLLPFRSCQPRI